MTSKGNALRSWSTFKRSHENAAPRRHCECLVGRQPLQVRYQHPHGRGCRHDTDDAAACTVSYHIGMLDVRHWLGSIQHCICNTTWGTYIDRTAVLDLGKEIKKNIVNDNMLAWQYNTIGVSDGITMGGEGMSGLFPSNYDFADLIQECASRYKPGMAC